MPEQFPADASGFHHVPVLSNELLNFTEALPSDLLDGGLLIDATVGGGGHGETLLKAYPQLRLIGLDQDAFAREAASKKLSNFGSRVKIEGVNFGDFVPPSKAVMVFADLGVSSHQLDVPARGFSFRVNGPLDMRMNQEKGITAAELIEELSEVQLADIIFQYGEERLSRRIARKIKKDLAQSGPYADTTQLAYAVAGCYPPKLRRGRLHPATKTFQALRIAVNDELLMLERFLTKAPDWLLPGGLFCVISFHSLEDRLVKSAFLNDPRLKRLTRKPVMASEAEILLNPRSRSAKFRVSCREDFS